MKKIWRSLIVVATTAACLAPTVGARAGAIPAPAVEHASCMGSGSAFYGTFATQQRAFVAQSVIAQAGATGTTPGATYAFFAQEKEGGSIPAPCGTRIE
jgi:hypothetical protein